MYVDLKFNIAAYPNNCILTHLLLLTTHLSFFTLNNLNTTKMHSEKLNFVNVKFKFAFYERQILSYYGFEVDFKNDAVLRRFSA